MTSASSRAGGSATSRAAALRATARASVECLEAHVRRYFLLDLRQARAGALADAEAFDEVLFAIERLGAYLAKGPAPLGGLLLYLRAVAESGMTLSNDASGAARSRFDRLFDLVLMGRNEALHQGAVARHLTSSSVEMALMLENGLMSDAQRIKDLMVDTPVLARDFESLGAIRRVMLMNAFSYLPLETEAGWKLVSDSALARYLRGCTPNERKSRLTMVLSDVIERGDIVLEDPSAVVVADDPLSSVLGRVDHRPALVLHPRGGPNALCGVITSFDLL